MKSSRWILLVLLLIALLVALNWAFPRTASVAVDTEARVALISAFPAEMVPLLAEAEISERVVINGRTHHVGWLRGQPVVLVESGISMVNAAMATQALLDHFTVKAIVVSGIAGGVNPDLNIGDVTVVERWGTYQEHIFARATSGGFDPGDFETRFGNYGMMFPRGVEVTRQGTPPDVTERRFWFAADADLVQQARDLGDLELGTCIPSGACLEEQPRVVVGGHGVSGPTFVDNAQYRAWVSTTFDADALDMETAAIAQVAYVHDVPFIAFRSLSDLAGGEEGPNQAQVFYQLAANNSAAVVLAFLEGLAH